MLVENCNILIAQVCLSAKCHIPPKKVGSASKAALCSVLFRHLDPQDCRTHFPEVPVNYIQNCRTPRSVASLATSDLFVRQRTEDRVRDFTHAAEVTSLLTWCTEHEFESHSGDTVEKYYRLYSKDTVYWEHYRGLGRGAIWICAHMLHNHPELIATLTLKAPNLSRSVVVSP
jgi:hypothetical protein